MSGGSRSVWRWWPYELELGPEVLHIDLPGELGQEHGGGFTPVDDALPVWIREIDLGYGGHPLEGVRESKELHAVYGVRRAELAHALPEDAEQLSGGNTRADVTLVMEAEYDSQGG
jgi:hypothetical protein